MGVKWGLNPPWLEQNFFYHVIWIAVVFRSNDSRCLLWKFSAIRVTRWLIWHPDCIKIQFRPGLCPGPRWGSLRRSPRSPSRLGRGNPLPHSLPLSTPSASRCRGFRRRTLRLRRLDSNFPHWEFLATPLSPPADHITPSAVSCVTRWWWQRFWLLTRTSRPESDFPRFTCSVAGCYIARPKLDAK